MDFGWFWYWYQLRCLTSVLPLNLGATLISINPGDMKMRNTQLLQSLLGVLLWIYWIYIVISPFINSESKQRNLKGFPWSLWSNSLRLLTQHIFNKGNHFKTPCGFGTKDCAEDLPSGFSAAMNGRSTRKELGKWFLVCVTIYCIKWMKYFLHLQKPIKNKAFAGNTVFSQKNKVFQHKTPTIVFVWARYGFSAN